jgi:hypothetical protein
MRIEAGKYIASYSHTDSEVRFLLRFSLLTGCIVGGMVVGMLMSAFN